MPVWLQIALGLAAGFSPALAARSPRLGLLLCALLLGAAPALLFEPYGWLLLPGSFTLGFACYWKLRPARDKDEVLLGKSLSPELAVKLELVAAEARAAANAKTDS